MDGWSATGCLDEESQQHRQRHFYFIFFLTFTSVLV